MNKCDRCGDEAEVETIEGFNLCSGCDSVRLSYINNPEEEKTLEDFKKEIENEDIRR
ncbi:MAG: hypothetical protein ACOC1X_02060 [Promethearchaeota archaeon]